MRKGFHAIVSFGICLCMILLAVPVRAAGQTLMISTREEFLTFAENCRLDTYSQEMTVSLAADIDLGGTDFEPIPIFSGIFEGNGHTISGLSITSSGSNIGLFRYLSQSAAVSLLNVEGNVTPGGSRSNIGGIAGVNEGKLFSCRFTGSVSGADRVGGLVGTNAVTGVIEQCAMESGSIHGSHFVGGIAGQNAGVIRSSCNKSAVNETVQQNSVDISDITIDTLTNSESVNTVTDIGGIAGSTSGVIRDCENEGTVGYPQIGYNIGGIAGTSSGYIVQCENNGSISGRKEVGGIAGQMKPVTFMDYSTDTLQILQGQLEEVSALANTAKNNAQQGASNIQSQIAILQQHTDTAKAAVDTLLPNREDPQLPDEDTIAAAQGSLAGSLGAIPGTMENIAGAAESTATTLTGDLQALTAGIDAISKTLDNASSTVGASISDVSDADTEDDLTGKLQGCVNHGTILADLNGGGITGAMAFENDLDHEADIYISGDLSLNSDTAIRCVILQCSNSATVTVKKANAGGIVGWQSMGLVKQCTNTGTLDAQDADNAGGIAGSSSGYIRSCNAKCRITGNVAVGGIAGGGAVVSDCRSMTLLEGSEQTGYVLGTREERYTTVETPITENYYFSIGKDIGGIDGISYAGCAQGLKLEQFLALEALPEIFGSATVTFLFEDGSQTVLCLDTGASLAADNIPILPVKDGFTGTWEGLVRENLQSVYFDTVFSAVYTPLQSTAQSSQLRPSGLPILLAQGEFLEASSMQAEPITVEGAIEAFRIAFSQGSTAEQLRWLLPDGYSADTVSVYVQNSNGWYEAPFSIDGSYLVFSFTPEDTAIALHPVQRNITIWIVLGSIAAAVVIGGTVTAILLRKRKKAHIR